ncbi:protein of unknown function (DUF5050) [Abditibacterium utsteinense]|uniref:Uncharacterized protein n=1 Tax=Abditibacterium utsteinense TaxID=1960156 RepID=A0A2S8SRD7_9BACT|nr:DUF5050 domain-containing protein [Abditibacterium utsteinense]PQV63382.1 protein of unknown function (DUF5050) [Abditibacterium utsteinense]
MKSLHSLFPLLLLGCLAASLARADENTAIPLAGKIAFTIETRNNPYEAYSMDHRIWVMNADGTNQTCLTPDLKTEQGPCFSPDGEKIVWSSSRPSRFQSPQIHAMNRDGTDSTLLNDWGIEPRFSADGKKIVFSSNRNVVDNIYVMNADGTEQNRLTTNLTNNLIHEAKYDVHPCFSPDGKKIVYTTWKRHNSQIWVMDADGTHPFRLSYNTNYDETPSFSPDGKKIVFTRRDAKREIYIMDADGHHQTRLTKSDFNNYHPCFSPDGKKTAFTRAGLGWEIYVMNVDGSNLTFLTKGGNDSQLSWAPGFIPAPK